MTIYSNAMIRDGFNGYPVGYNFPTPAIEEVNENDEGEQEWLLQNPNAKLNTTTGESVVDAYLIELSEGEDIF